MKKMIIIVSSVLLLILISFIYYFNNNEQKKVLIDNSSINKWPKIELKWEVNTRWQTTTSSWSWFNPNN